MRYNNALAYLQQAHTAAEYEIREILSAVWKIQYC